jgi:hypothetical protein
MGQSPVFVGDELPHCKTVLAEEFSHCELASRTGKRGRPQNPKRALDKDLLYATVKKTRKKGRIAKVERAAAFGNESDIAARLKKSPSKTINTAYVERSNLDWRLWDAHSPRKSVAFRSAQWLEAKLFICVVFCVVWRHFARIPILREYQFYANT